jgi:hypothetical protein
MEADAASGIRRALAAHFSGHQVARVVYGSIIGIALVVALESHPPTAGVVVGSLLATAFAIALAELYSDVIGARVMHRREFNRAHLAAISKDVAAVAFGISFPAVYFVLAAAGALDLDTAFTLAKWSGVALMGFYGVCAARLGGEGLSGSLLQGVGAALIGVALIAVKSLLH